MSSIIRLLCHAGLLAFVASSALGQTAANQKIVFSNKTIPATELKIRDLQSNSNEVLESKTRVAVSRYLRSVLHKLQKEVDVEESSNKIVTMLMSLDKRGDLKNQENIFLKVSKELDQVAIVIHSSKEKAEKIKYDFDLVSKRDLPVSKVSHMPTTVESLSSKSKDHYSIEVRYRTSPNETYTTLVLDSVDLTTELRLKNKNVTGSGLEWEGLPPSLHHISFKRKTGKKEKFTVEYSYAQDFSGETELKQGSTTASLTTKKRLVSIFKDGFELDVKIKKKAKSLKNLAMGAAKFATAVSLIYLGIDPLIEWRAMSMTKDMEHPTLRTTKKEITIVDRSGALLGEPYKNSDFIPYEELSENVKVALLLFEDSAFFEHNGIDKMRGLKALFQNIHANGIVRGASTLENQTASILYPDYIYEKINEGSDEAREQDLIYQLEAKMWEAAISIRLNNTLSKEERLAIYAAYADMGRFLGRGIDARAAELFGASVRAGAPNEITGLQAMALVISLPQPNALRVGSLKHTILMRKLAAKAKTFGLITEADMEKLALVGVVTKEGYYEQWEKIDPAYFELNFEPLYKDVIRDIYSAEGSPPLRLAFESNYDSEIQTRAQAIVQDAVNSLKSKGITGAGVEIRVDGAQVAHVGHARTEKAKASIFTEVSETADTIKNWLEEVKKTVAENETEQGADCLLGGTYSVARDCQMVSGSVMKMFVYAAAIENGMPYSLAMEDGFATSSNTYAEYVWSTLGPDRVSRNRAVADFIARFAGDNEAMRNEAFRAIQYNPTYYLGGNGLGSEVQLDFLQAVNNYGMLKKASPINTIYDLSTCDVQLATRFYSEKLDPNAPSQQMSQSCLPIWKAKELPAKKMMEPTTASIMKQLLTATASRGTAADMRNLNNKGVTFSNMAKTGTGENEAKINISLNNASSSQLTSRSIYGSAEEQTSGARVDLSIRFTSRGQETSAQAVSLANRILEEINKIYEKRLAE